jgi:RNA polymerase sigma-70 factor (ECF subfamily)
MEALSDIALVTQVAVLHNTRAFDQLVRKYQSAVRRFLLNLTLGDEALSDDLAQDTFLKAYTHIAQFRAVASFQTWLFRIAYNVFYDYKRSSKFTVQSSQFMADSSQLPADKINGAANCELCTVNFELKNDIYKAMSLLKEDERTCITLQLIDGQPIDQIARITGMGENTVKSHLRRGKEKLATFLKNNGYERR